MMIRWTESLRIEIWLFCRLCRRLRQRYDHDLQLNAFCNVVHRIEGHEEEGEIFRGSERKRASERLTASFPLFLSPRKRCLDGSSIRDSSTSSKTEAFLLMDRTNRPSRQEGGQLVPPAQMGTVLCLLCSPIDRSQVN